jgi:putative ABC transport system permease protein
MDAVWVHRFRSLLTILGIVIGITTVVTVSSLLTGLREGFVTFFQELGPDNVFIYKFSGDPNASRGPQKEQKRRAIKPEYADQIKRFAGSVEDTTLTLFIPPVLNGLPVVAKVPGFETENLNMVGAQPN